VPSRERELEAAKRLSARLCSWVRGSGLPMLISVAMTGDN
jgi:hypothetical protein